MKKKQKKTWEQEPTGVYQEIPCENCKGRMSLFPGYNMYKCISCGEEEDLVDVPVKSFSIKSIEKLHSK